MTGDRAADCHGELSPARQPALGPVEVPRGEQHVPPEPVDERPAPDPSDSVGGGRPRELRHDAHAEHDGEIQPARRGQHAGEPERDLGRDRHAAGLGEGEKDERGVARLSEEVLHAPICIDPGPRSSRRRVARPAGGRRSRVSTVKTREHRRCHSRRLRPWWQRAPRPARPRCRPERPQPATTGAVPRRGLRLPRADLRAHGASTAPAMFGWDGFVDDVLDAAARLGLHRPVAFGHSLGATAILGAEAANPGTFSHIFCYEPIVFSPALPEPPDEAIASVDTTPPGRVRLPRRGGGALPGATALFGLGPRGARRLSRGWPRRPGGRLRRTRLPHRRTRRASTRPRGTATFYGRLGADRLPGDDRPGIGIPGPLGRQGRRIAARLAHGSLAEFAGLDHFGPTRTLARGRSGPLGCRYSQGVASGPAMPLSLPSTLSPSKLSRFVQCPLSFRFAYIDRLPEPSSIQQVRGTLVHKALELLFGSAQGTDRTATGGSRSGWPGRRSRRPRSSPGWRSTRRHRITFSTTRPSLVAVFLARGPGDGARRRARARPARDPRRRRAARDHRPPRRSRRWAARRCRLQDRPRAASARPVAPRASPASTSTPCSARRCSAPVPSRFASCT